MSWFDAAGLANIAKSALREAQKTIDKALDIKDEPNLVPVNTPVDPSLDDFFGTWGLQTQAISTNADAGTQKEDPSNSLWGSFTGSFFDTNKDAERKPKLSTSQSLDDTVDSTAEHFTQSKLVVERHGEDTTNEDGNDTTDKKCQSQFTDLNLENAENPNQIAFLNVTSMKRTNKPQNFINRLSVISSESEKNSSESVDVITCSSTTTSPESDLLSASTSSSALGLKPTSESVEVLGESLTSPSSVEVLSINSNSIHSTKHSQHTDEFVSPLNSPWQEDKSSSVEQISPESVEVIQGEQEENSIADDTMSYTSISESTSATVLDSAFNTHFKYASKLKEPFPFSESLSESVPHDASLSPEKSYPFSEAITRAPSRSTLQLPLTSTVTDTQSQSINQKTNVIDIPTDSDISTSMESQIDLSLDDGSQSDKTLIGSDNLLESGSSDTSTATDTVSHSSYLKNMLADAMTEKNSSEHGKSGKFLGEDTLKSISFSESLSLSQIEMPPRENSPISSESRSDLVKVGSDHTSGHTSGDELETTTSSDIEIISSPNGDSSSTQSRQSPAKITASTKCKSDDSQIDSLLCKMSIKKAKGHNRELSEASSISDDSHSSEIDRLLKRISEMTEILESRESKLIDMNRRNAELQEQNGDLRLQLDSIITKQLETADVNRVTEEYTQRLSALEKKFQQAIREKDNLRKQLEQVKQEAAKRITKGEFEGLINEKDETIKELREEGEKLSKQQLHHSNIIKKLRAKEKENEATIKHLRESVESLTAECDRLRKSLTAKDDVERAQIEAVHQLTNKNKKLETEVNKLKENLDDLTQKYETVKKSLDAAKKELLEKNRTSSELQAREQMLESLESQKKITESQNEEMLNQLENLRYKLRQAEDELNKKEQKYREENVQLTRKLEEAEARNEELSQSILEVSKPLVRQLDSLQATHSMKVATFEKIEEELTSKITELQTQLQTSSSLERQAKDECAALRLKLGEFEGKKSSLKHSLEMLEMQLQQQTTENLMVQQDLKNKIVELEEILKKEKEITADQEKQIASLQQELGLEKSANEMERRQMESTMVQNKNFSKRPSSSRAESDSPTLSLGKVSMSESMSSSLWSQDEPFEVGQTPRYTSVFEMQMLQSNLKQREGELQQLQWELNRREQERSLLNSEISTLLTRVEDLEDKVKDYEILKNKHQEIEQQYETLCQLYGEKVEENEELKLDLEDVKEMYKGQIDELLRQLKQK